MLGALTFLPTYLQFVKGVSATASGVQTLPLVAGLLVTLMACEAPIVGRTGHLQDLPRGRLPPDHGGRAVSPVAGVDAHTQLWRMALGMLVLALGIELCMQVLTIVVQSTVDYRDLGVAT